LTDQKHGNESSSTREPPIIPLGPWCIAKIKRKLHQRCAERENEGTQERSGRRTADATVAIAFFSIVAVGVGALQYCTLEKTDETMRNQQRAWIEPGLPIIQSPSNFVGGVEKIDLIISYRNIGNEPALGAVIALDNPLLVVDPPPDGNWYARLPGENRVCAIAAPNKQGITIWQSKEFAAHKFPNQRVTDADLVLSGKKSLVIQGCIGYLTIGERHYSGFCYYWDRVADRPPNVWRVVKCQTRNNAF
jgi:hypothetical protein